MISIIIPAYNEEKAIVDTIKRCKKVLENYDGSEIIIVDDCSKDKTYELISAEDVNIIKHPHNIGYGKSLKDGILLAKNDTIAISDADGTYPIEDIPILEKEFRKGFDMVVGARQGSFYDESFKKMVLRKILKYLVEFAAGRKIKDINSGLRVFSKETIVQYFNKLCNTYSFSTSMTLAYMMNGKFVSYVPIKYKKRIGSSKVKIFRDSLRTMQFIIEAIMFYNPIKIFILFSLFLILQSILSFILAFLTHFQIAYILGIASILLSILNFSLGLLAVQLQQILSNGKS
jgi:polyisoprenyl-phosphate glycosyltransferase